MSDGKALYLSLLFVSGYALYLQLLFWAVRTLSVRGAEMPSSSDGKEHDHEPATLCTKEVLGELRTDGYTAPYIAPTASTKG